MSVSHNPEDPGPFVMVVNPLNDITKTTDGLKERRKVGENERWRKGGKVCSVKLSPTPPHVCSPPASLSRLHTSLGVSTASPHSHLTCSPARLRAEVLSAGPAWKPPQLPLSQTKKKHMKQAFVSELQHTHTYKTERPSRKRVEVIFCFFS